jgi:transposase-like protein
MAVHMRCPHCKHSAQANRIPNFAVIYECPKCETKFCTACGADACPACGSVHRYEVAKIYRQVPEFQCDSEERKLKSDIDNWLKKHGNDKST